MDWDAISRDLEANGFRVKALRSSSKRTKHVLVVPAFDEAYADVKRLLDSAFGADDGVRVVLVVNESRASSTDARQRNAELVDLLRDYAGELTLLHVELHPYVGVGGARRAGCYIARSLQEAHEVESTLVHNTDADSLLPPRFFSDTAVALKRDTAAVLHSLGHFPGGDLACYEAACVQRSLLMLAILNLSAMRSPWAFTMTGCGVSIPAWAYDASGGWPAVSVAEDIYLAGYLAKAGRIQRMPHLRVLTSSRDDSKGLPWPGDCPEGAGHGAMVGAIKRGLAHNRAVPEGDTPFELVGVSPAHWAAMGVVYDLIWGYLDGRYVGDQRECAAKAIAARGLDFDPKHIDDAITNVVGPLSAMVGPPSPNRAVKFFGIFDQELQQKTQDGLDAFLERVDIERCVNESPWGVKHTGDWVATAASLAALEEQHCTADVGIGSLEGWTLEAT